MSHEPSIQLGKPFDATQQDRDNDPWWAILYTDLTWADSTVYLPETLAGPKPYGVVLYKDRDNQTRRVWGSSWVAYFPGPRVWLDMDDRDMDIWQNVYYEPFVGLTPGLLMHPTAWEDIFRHAAAHPFFQEVHPDFNEQDYDWVPTSGLIAREHPDLSERFALERDPDGAHQTRIRALRQMAIDRYHGGDPGWYPGTPDAG